MFRNNPDAYPGGSFEPHFGLIVGLNFLPDGLDSVLKPVYYFSAPPKVVYTF